MPVIYKAGRSIKQASLMMGSKAATKFKKMVTKEYFIKKDMKMVELYELEKMRIKVVPTP